MQLKIGVRNPMQLGATSTETYGKNSVVSTRSRWFLFSGFLFRCEQITYIERWKTPDRYQAHIISFGE